MKFQFTKLTAFLAISIVCSNANDDLIQLNTAWGQNTEIFDTTQNLGFLLPSVTSGLSYNQVAMNLSGAFHGLSFATSQQVGQMFQDAGVGYNPAQNNGIYIQQQTGNMFELIHEIAGEQGLNNPIPGLQVLYPLVLVGMTGDTIISGYQPLAGITVNNQNDISVGVGVYSAYTPFINATIFTPNIKNPASIQFQADWAGSSNIGSWLVFSTNTSNLAEVLPQASDSIPGAVPLPPSFFMFATGLLGFAAIRRMATEA